MSNSLDRVTKRGLLRALRTLRPKTLQMASALYANRGRVMLRGELVDDLWGNDPDGGPENPGHCLHAHAYWLRRAGIPATAHPLGWTIPLLLLLFIAVPAFAHDPEGNPAVNNWLTRQHNMSGWWCCDGNDVTYLDPGQWGIDDKGYWALFDGGKTRVADHLLVDPSGGPNPTHRAILWSIGGGLRCFAPGTMS